MFCPLFNEDGHLEPEIEGFAEKSSETMKRSVARAVPVMSITSERMSNLFEDCLFDIIKLIM